MPVRSVHMTNYYHKNSGGISTSYNNLLEAAGRQRRFVRLIVPGESEAVEDVNEYARIYYVPARYSPVFDKRYRIIMPWQYMPNDSVIRRILLSEMPDIIEVTDKYTLSMMGAMIRVGKFKQIGRPMLVHFSCERMDDNIRSFLSGGSIGQWIAKRSIANYLLPSFDFHIANSAYTAAEFYESISNQVGSSRSTRFFNYCWRAFKAPRISVNERIFVCPRGVDTAKFSPKYKAPDARREIQKQADLPENAILLLYAGRISPEKNIGLLADMMTILAEDADRDFRLLVAGAGPQAEWLRAQGDSIGSKKIIQFGHLDKDTLARYYANVDVFVHPNPREPFGIAPLEAMASGVPTLAPNSGGILSYATNENAWLVEPTAVEFAAAVRAIVDDQVLSRTKSARALETAISNTREASTELLFATYDSMYEDFHVRNDLFTNIEEPRTFDYSRITDL